MLVCHDEAALLPLRFNADGTSRASRLDGHEVERYSKVHNPIPGQHNSIGRQKLKAALRNCLERARHTLRAFGSVRRCKRPESPIRRGASRRDSTPAHITDPHDACQGVIVAKACSQPTAHRQQFRRLKHGGPGSSGWPGKPDRNRIAEMSWKMSMCTW